MLNFSSASENNKQPIYARLKDYFGNGRTVLEIGSGSGQHGIEFSGACQGLAWQLTELGDRLPALESNRRQYAPHLPPAITLDVRSFPWPVAKADIVYTANTLHIISEHEVACLVRGAADRLMASGLFCVYGPFRYQGKFTSASNGEFDRWLRANDSASGIRDFERVDDLATRHGLALLEDFAMPANNQLIVWQRSI